MSKEIVINADQAETRIAILEDGELVELLFERPDKRRIVGDIFKGRVNAVIPGMQAAFVELGLERTGFLHASDLASARPKIMEGLDAEDEGASTNGAHGGGARRPGGRGGGRLPRRGADSHPRIEEHLKPGQEVLVQITKEPISTKGPRVSQQISLPGRYLVFMPQLDHLGVSRKIMDPEERHRLRDMLSDLKPNGSGLIVRTVGEGKDVRHFRSDVRFLSRMWDDVQKRARRERAPALLHREMELTTGLIRDLFTEEVDRVVLDGKKEHKEILSYLKNYAPELRNRVELYESPTPILDRFGIEPEIEKTFERKVWLKKGGYIVIDHTEALVTIDVNTGRYTGKTTSQEETILRANLEAAKEIARQLRLRDIGGIIVIDFIDMEIEANKRAVLDELRAHLRKDRARTKTFGVSDLGLVEMTRQRVRPSLLHYFSDDCPTCDGVGKVLSLESVGMAVERMLKRAGRDIGEKRLELHVSPEVAVFLMEERGARIGQIERTYSMEVDIVDDPNLRRHERRLKVVGTSEDVTERVEA
jgi:ribonuclease G